MVDRFPTTASLPDLVAYAIIITMDKEVERLLGDLKQKLNNVLVGLQAEIILYGSGAADRSGDQERGNRPMTEKIIRK